MNITSVIILIIACVLVGAGTGLFCLARRRKALLDVKNKYEKQIEALQSQLSARIKSLEIMVEQFSFNNRELKRINDTKSKFMSIVAHDLKQPLTSISGYTSLLMEDPNYKNDIKILENISKATSNMNRLMNDLVDASVMESGKLNLTFRPFNFNDLISEVYNQYRVIAEQRKILFRKFDFPEAVEVKGDKFRLNQVISNLLNNAFKFTPEGGTIEMRYYIEDNMLKTVITDTGVGIDSYERMKIFEKFHQVPTVGDEQKKVGWGLGLSIAYDIIKAHKGIIGVDSPGLGLGSSFWFSINI